MTRRNKTRLTEFTHQTYTKNMTNAGKSFRAMMRMMTPGRG